MIAPESVACRKGAERGKKLCVTAVNHRVCVSEEHFHSLRDQKHSSAREKDKKDQVKSAEEPLSARRSHTSHSGSKQQNKKREAWLVLATGYLFRRIDEW
jgi:hypothetical protein